MADTKVPQPKPNVARVSFTGSNQDKFQAALDKYIADQKEKGVETELVDTIVATEFHLTLDSHARVTVPIGYQTMPREWADHWFAQAHGVSMREGDAPSPKEKAPVKSDAERVADNARQQGNQNGQGQQGNGNRPVPPKA